MGVKDLITDKVTNDGSVSLSRVVAIGTFIVLSAGFILSAVYNAVSWEVYIAYPLGVSIAFAPQLFLRLLNGIREVLATWKNQQTP